ncbi:hypothetical protein C0993_007498 [Termitomyces sp. T159_Od127]|nr:hypothetical protein C0993_007498 [Termitomyces sp. T159_Od127]
MGIEVLLQHLEAGEQPVPPTVSLLQDNLAVTVMEGLLNQIELMWRQCILALKQIDHAAKCKRPTAASTGPALLAVMPVWPTAASTGQATLLSMLAGPVATPARQLAVATLASVALIAPKALEVQRAMDEEMVVVKAGGAVPPLKGTAGPPRHGPPATSQAPDALRPSKTHQEQKPPLAASQLEIVNFPANIPVQAEAAQMLFMKAVVLPAPPEQYDIVANMAAKKGKHCEAPPINDNSNYGESQSEEEEEEEEGKMPAQYFQRVQQNKKIAKKKANKAKAAATLVHQAQNDFSSHIPNRLKVKIWGPLNVERLNLCFRGAIGLCCYYSYQTNTVFVSAKANWVVTFKFSSGQQV